MSPSAAAFEDFERLLASSASAGIRPGLGRISRLLHILGDPQDAWPALHVVGTNGKGSTCAFLDSVLRASGCRTAFYSSPHLDSPGERLLIDGKPLEGERWLDALRRVNVAVKRDATLAGDPPSYFELLTATAFLLAAEGGAEVAVVEAGLGGRLDATNLLGRVLCSVVASISRDHMEYLGDTLEAIAGEKFAVVRPRTPACFVGTPSALTPLFRSFCADRGALPFVLTEEARLEDVSVTEEGCSFDFRSPRLDLKGVRTRMAGRYQLDNAALALLALSCVREALPRVTPASILQGMEAARWPGRLEILSRKPLLVLDGGHNRDGVARLVESVAELWPGLKKFGVVYAAMRDKEYGECLSLLSALHPALYAAEVPGMGRCLPAGELLEAARNFSWGREPRAFASPLEAVRAALEENEGVLVCGSLYLIGWIRPRLRAALGLGDV
ncbi:MAG: bifunctional folylpolyglutamate synthase/dihydrofolate synthase [Fretibacterium sp.]|nr:bifunctional folylpolyglutamate synthase/dihydrofolate synthase [Fretibacterium sp.]